MTKFSTEKLAPLDAPLFTGDARAVTAAPGDSDTSVATTAFVAASGGGFTTGDAKLTLKTVADAGWVLMNDGTIGDATSGATTRANADCQALFVLMWTNMSNAWCPVLPGGRGATALADFNAHKTLLMPYQLGRSIAIAGVGSGLTSRVLGSLAGAETESPTIGKTASHNHSMGHGAILVDGGATYTGLALLSPSYTLYTNNQGGDAPLNILDPTSYWNVMIKL
jgi:hypothetical protein